jgi:hypothetical protein
MVDEAKEDGLEEMDPGHLDQEERTQYISRKEWKNMQIKQNNQDIRSCSMHKLIIWKLYLRLHINFT